MATITITTTPAEDARIVKVFTRILQPMTAAGAPRNVTTAEIKQAVIDLLRVRVREVEEVILRETAAPVNDINPT